MLRGGRTTPQPGSLFPLEPEGGSQGVCPCSHVLPVGVRIPKKLVAWTGALAIVLQLTDPHLLEDPLATLRGVPTRRTLVEVLALARARLPRIDRVVLTGDLAAGMGIAEQLRAGTVNVNEGYAPAWSATRAPMGGMKDSGIGRRHGDEGLLKYTESQTIGVMRTMGFGPPFGWSDQRWGDTLTRTVRAMKSLGLK